MSCEWYNWPLLCGHRSDGLVWVRLFGFGVHMKDTTKWPLLFGERNRLRFGVAVGKYYIGFLEPML